MNPSRYWLEREIKAFADSLPPGALVLDAGAGSQRYRPLFSHQTYEAADFEQVDKPYAKSTYVCDLAEIPVEAARFDAILFSQVMEHLPDPPAALREFSRVLKPGGVIFCSAPFSYMEHEQPYDFFRYTQFGMRSLFENAGFKVHDVRWLEGFMGTAYWQMRWLARYLPLSPRKLGGGFAGIAACAIMLLLKPLLVLGSWIAARCDVRHRYTHKGYPMNYVVVAEKPIAVATPVLVAADQREFIPHAIAV